MKKLLLGHIACTACDAGYCYRRISVVGRSVCLSVSVWQLVTFLSLAKTAEPIEMPFEGWLTLVQETMYYMESVSRSDNKKYGHGRCRRYRASTPKASRGWKMGYPLSSRLWGLGNVLNSPSGVRGGSPAEMWFCKIWMPIKEAIRRHVFHWIFCRNSTVVVQRGRGCVGTAWPLRKKTLGTPCPPPTGACMESRSQAGKVSILGLSDPFKSIVKSLRYCLHCSKKSITASAAVYAAKWIIPSSVSAAKGIVQSSIMARHAIRPFIKILWPHSYNSVKL